MQGYGVAHRFIAASHLMHSSENTSFYAVMWLCPTDNTRFVATCDADFEDAATACNAAITMLIRRF